jgi:hypothetical protein
MEILFEIAAVVIQFLGEFLLQMAFEFLAELGMLSVREVFRRPEPMHPALAAIGYCVLGAGAGAASIFFLPASVIQAPSHRLANLLITPLAAGALMAMLGSWRRRRDQETIRLDRFSYGFLFALAMALVRFIWATPV